MDGFININKPKDFTSQDVLNVIKRSFRGTKIGHGGTLDPGATGVLPVCLGKCTKLQDYVMGCQKTYIAQLTFGCHSSTLDKDGDWTVVNKDFQLDRGRLEAVLPQFIGEIQQIPPMVSAIKKDGVALYKLAHKGIELDLPPRPVTIYSIEILEIKEAQPLPWVKLKVTCSKGTYIRSLARDIGFALDTEAMIWELTRTATGRFKIEDSYTIDEVAAMVKKGDYSFLLPPEDMLESMVPVVAKDIGAVAAVLQGNAIDCPQEISEGTTVKILDHNRVLLGLGQVKEKGVVKTEKVLYSCRRRKNPMEIWQSPGDKQDLSKGTVVALGNFDGVHLGHRYILEHMALAGERKGLFSVALTFCPHPKDFFTCGSHKYLQTKAAKTRHIDATGVDALLFLPFDVYLSSLTGAEFVNKILINSLNAKVIYVGYNFKFGSDGKGSRWLREYCGEKGIEVRVIEKVTYNGAEVSSSVVKEKLAAGDIAAVNRLLGCSFSLEGEVVTGNQLGRTIGFPTANVDFSSSVILPAPGIYITWAKYRGKRHPSVTNVGYRPTVGDNLEPTVEVHILDENPDVYGENMEVLFLSRLRGEEKFPNMEALKDKIVEDAERARKYFAARGR